MSISPRKHVVKYIFVAGTQSHCHGKFSEAKSALGIVSQTRSSYHAFIDMLCNRKAVGISRLPQLVQKVYSNEVDRVSDKVRNVTLIQEWFSILAENLNGSIKYCASEVEGLNRISHFIFVAEVNATLVRSQYRIFNRVLKQGAHGFRAIGLFDGRSELLSAALDRAGRMPRQSLLRRYVSDILEEMDLVFRNRRLATPPAIDLLCARVDKTGQAPVWPIDATGKSLKELHGVRWT
jgi:hypothetical protein